MATIKIVLRNKRQLGKGWDKGVHYPHYFSTHSQSMHVMTSKTSVQQELKFMLKEFMLRFADDIVLLAEEKKDLEEMLNCIDDVLRRNYMKINKNKTKVVVSSENR